MRPKILTGIVYATIGLLLDLLNPFFISKLIEWIEKDDAVWWTGLLFALGIGAVSHSKAYLYRRGVFSESQLEVELHSIVKQSVFDKILTIPMTSLNMIDFGLISNIITSDLLSVIHYAYFLIVGYSSIIFMIPALAIFYYHYEWYFLFAPAWITVLMLVNAAFTEVATHFMIKRTKYSDNLGVLANEIVKGIKNIKFNVWEKISLKKTMEQRRGDGKMNSLYILLNQNINNFSYFVPTLIVASIHIAFTR